MPFDCADLPNLTEAFLMEADQRPSLGRSNLILAIRQVMDKARAGSRPMRVAELSERLWREAAEHLRAACREIGAIREEVAAIHDELFLEARFEPTQGRHGLQAERQRALYRPVLYRRGMTNRNRRLISLQFSA
ncbi:hypothetical protein MHZ93_11915 [Roseomonas sp. ACRSG]|nr:hypothetical protein [Roseomonas sp. ACRSG]